MADRSREDRLEALAEERRRRWEAELAKGPIDWTSGSEVFPTEEALRQSQRGYRARAEEELSKLLSQQPAGPRSS